MPLPQSIFIDTCILDAEQYDFNSSQIQALATAAAGRNLKLLLPHPTKQEITRHIKERAQAAVSSLKSARKEHPFLRKCPALPQSRVEREKLERDMRNAVLADWKGFQGNFVLQELDYTGVDLDEVMAWYDQGRPPFGLGEKSKEFPDAFAFIALRDYAKASNQTVAVVSSDNDFKAACAHTPALHHFPSLAALISALLAENTRFAAATQMAAGIVAPLTARIIADFADRAFDHSEDPNGHGYVDDVVVTDVVIDLESIEIIGLGHQEFTIVFPAAVSFTAHVEYDDPNSWVSGDPGDDVMYLHRCKGVVSDEAAVACVVRISTDENWTSAGEITSFIIEDQFIEVNTEAPQSDEPGDYDYEPATDTPP